MIITNDPQRIAWQRYIYAQGITDASLKTSLLARFDNGEVGLRTGLLAHWKLNETAGTRYDSHGSYNLTDIGSVGYATGKIGNAATFNETNQTLERVEAAFNSAWGDFSVSLWFKEDDQVGYQVIFGSYLGSAGLNIAVSGAGLDVNDMSIAGLHLDSGLSTGVWYHLCVSRLSGVNTLYVDGVASGTSEQDIGLVGKVALGNAGNNYLWYGGAIDSTSIWSRGLTSAEVGLLYNSGSGLDYANIL